MSSLHTTSSYGGSMLSVTTSEEGYERVSIQSDKGTAWGWVEGGGWMRKGERGGEKERSKE